MSASWLKAGAAFAAVNGAVAVAAGAYARHGMAGNAYGVELLEIAVRYQMIHALALLTVVCLVRATATPLTPGNGGGKCRRCLLPALAITGFSLGLVLFCGTLYLLALGGPVVAGLAPVGGFAFIAGWLALAATAWTRL